MICCSDSLEFLKNKKDFEFDINYADVPYALGSEVIIQENGKPEYKKAVDFMDKWKMPNGAYWEQWFKEAFRTLKYGGYCLIFGIDRQLMLFKYYAAMAGFVEQQSLYWYFISNFPKATDLSKMIDKNAGAERNIIGVKKQRANSDKSNSPLNKSISDVEHITVPSTELAKKYNGYKYSIAPLKQTNETVMVFQKPYKTGSCLHDTLAHENDDSECCCGSLNIDGNRVGTEIVSGGGEIGQRGIYGKLERNKDSVSENIGRYPAQTFIDSETAKILDKQSGIQKGGGAISKHQKEVQTDKDFAPIQHNGFEGFDDIGGCSKILHKCDYESGEFDLYHYCPKVSQFERNAGCEELELKQSANLPMRSKDIKSENKANDGTNTHRTTTNNHPTLKPISLNHKILSLFKTPNNQKIIFPFAGSGSEIIGGLKAGFDEYEACEINPDYIEIANKRIEYWSKVNFELDREKHYENIQMSATIDLDDIF